MSAPNGPHLSLPFRIGEDGRTAHVRSLDEHVHDELIQLILTNVSERACLPTFGGSARRLVFDGAGVTTAAMAKAMISQALSRWLGNRLAVERLDVQAKNEKLEIDLVYRVAGSPPRRVLFQRGGG